MDASGVGRPVPRQQPTRLERGATERCVEEIDANNFLLGRGINKTSDIICVRVKLGLGTLTIYIHLLKHVDHMFITLPNNGNHGLRN